MTMYEERPTFRPEPRVMNPSKSDVTLTRLKEAMLAEGIRACRVFVDMLFPEDERGRRVPILHEVITDEREEWNFLEETYRMWRLWKMGYIQPDSHVMRFDRNEDNAQERLLELRRQFAMEARDRIRAAGQ